MKPKNFILIALVVAIVCLGIRWFTRPTVPVPEKIAEVPMPTKSVISKQIAPTTINPSIAPTTPKPGSTSVADVSPPPDPNADPQADLKTAIPDIVRLLRAGDLTAFRKSYAPPDELDLQWIQEMQELQAKIGNSMEFQQTTELSAQEFETFESQTPTYNDAGDEATYMRYPPRYPYEDRPEDPSPLTFIKINGKWYMK